MKVGTVVIGSNGVRYRVGEKVGEGVMGEVFEGVHEVTGMRVALKVLRGGVRRAGMPVGALVAGEFWLEGEVLRELGQAEQRRGDGVRGVPRVFDVQREGEVGFIVLEWVDGVPLDEVLRAQPYLSEGDALVVAEQLLRVLDLLHQQGRSVSPHFSLRRIWLQRGADGTLEGVKVMDWRQVSEKLPEGEPVPDGFGMKDLACVGAHLYRMLTGKGADEQGETEHALERRAGTRWQALSLGTRQVLLRALRADFARRFSHAGAFRAAVQAQQALWRQDPFDLMLDVKRWLRDPILDVDQVAHITARLDMAERLGAPAKHVRVYWQQLEQHIGQISLNWKTGEQYYRAEQYREALTRWREEAEIKGHVGLWRWVMLAQMGVTLGRASFASLRDQMEDAVQALDQGDVARAFELLEALQIAGVRSESFATLRQEALARHKIEQAQQAEASEEPTDWENAALAYRDAAAALQEIPYVSLIYDNQPEWPNLLDRSAALEQQAAQQRDTKQAERDLQALLQQDFEEGQRLLHTQLRHNPTCRWLLRLCLAEGTRHLAARQYGQAEALLAIGVLFGQVGEYDGQLRQSWLEAIAKRQLVRELEPVKVEYEKEVAVLREQHTQEMGTLERAYQKAFGEQVKRYEQKLAETESEQEQKLANLRDTYQEALDKEEREHEQTWKTMRQQYKHELANAKATHEQEWQRLRQQQQQDLAQAKAMLEQEFQQNLHALESEQRKKLHNAKNLYEQELKVFEMEKEAAIKKLAIRHAQKIAKKRAESDAILAAYERKQQGDVAEINRKHRETVATLNAQYEGEVKQLEQQQQNTLAKLNKQHQWSLADTEHQLAEVRQQQEAMLNAEQSEVDKLLASLRPKNDQRLIEELNRLLEEERWDDFLTVAAKTPERLLARQRVHWRAKIVQLNKRFQEVVHAYRVLLAQKLLSVLTVLEPDSRHMRWRQAEYDRMVQKFHRETSNWSNQIAKLVEKRRWEASSKEDYQQLVSDIEQLLVFSKQQYPQLTQWLRDTRQQMIKRVERSNVTRKSKGHGLILSDLSMAKPRNLNSTDYRFQEVPVVESVQRTELSRLVQIGFSQVGQLTADSLREAEGSFEQALELMQSAKDKDNTQRSKVLAGMKLIRYLGTPLGSNISIYVQRINHLREFLDLSQDRETVLEWFSGTPVIKWMEEAKGYVNRAKNAWAGNKKREAALFSQAAFKLLLVIEVIIYGWWREVIPDDNDLILPVLQELEGLKEHVLRQPFFRG